MLYVFYIFSEKIRRQRAQFCFSVSHFFKSRFVCLYSLSWKIKHIVGKWLKFALITCGDKKEKIILYAISLHRNLCVWIYCHQKNMQIVAKWLKSASIYYLCWYNDMEHDSVCLYTISFHCDFCDSRFLLPLFTFI